MNQIKSKPPVRILNGLSKSVGVVQGEAGVRTAVPFFMLFSMFFSEHLAAFNIT